MSKNTKNRKKKSSSSVSSGVFVITLLLVIAAAVAVSFAACGGNQSSGDSSEGTKQSGTEEQSGVASENKSEDVSAPVSDGNESSNENASKASGDSSENTSEDASKEESTDSSDQIIDTMGGGEKYSHISWFKAENGRRYDAYGEKNPSYTLEQVVTYVNIGLDGPYYTNTYKADEADGNFILVNKYSYVDRNYVPDNLVELDSSCKISGKSVKLVKEAADAFKKLSEEAAELEYYILGMSGYRSYAYQENLYNRYLQNDTKEKVDTYSARPGYSEHHTGLALDVQTNTASFSEFGQTKEYEWLLDNAHKYGFVIHYTSENQWITGYMPEEWHIRYLGVDAATYIYDNNLSVDEYLVMYGAEGPQAVG